MSFLPPRSPSVSSLQLAPVCAAANGVASQGQVWHCHPRSQTRCCRPPSAAPEPLLLSNSQACSSSCRRSTAPSTLAQAADASPGPRVLLLRGVTGRARMQALAEKTGAKVAETIEAATSPWQSAQATSFEADCLESFTPLQCEAACQEAASTPCITFRTSSPGTLYRSISALAFGAGETHKNDVVSETRLPARPRAMVETVTARPDPVRSMPLGRLLAMPGLNGELLKRAEDHVRKIDGVVAEAELAAQDVARLVTHQLRPLPRPVISAGTTRPLQMAGGRDLPHSSYKPPPAPLSWEEVALPSSCRHAVATPVPRPQPGEEEDELLQSSVEVASHGTLVVEHECERLRRLLEETEQQAQLERQHWRQECEQFRSELLAASFAIPGPAQEEPVAARPEAKPKLGSIGHFPAEEEAAPQVKGDGSSEPSQQAPRAEQSELDRLKQNLQAALAAMTKLGGTSSLSAENRPPPQPKQPASSGLGSEDVRAELERMKKLCSC
eukprot:TRINITY_DN14823_c0_g1_i3.p1 TRINITY_DN14823_c0_g1~~TRINITY_DN14823_c0_g1_i3.p1  ORF type:complete len:499 (+),score=108.64 TRINITY_DN14823_c0_g1_i3:66-1562(+)